MFRWVGKVISTIAPDGSWSFANSANITRRVAADRSPVNPRARGTATAVTWLAQFVVFAESPEGPNSANCGNTARSITPSRQSPVTWRVPGTPMAITGLAQFVIFAESAAGPESANCANLARRVTCLEVPEHRAGLRGRCHLRVEVDKRIVTYLTARPSKMSLRGDLKPAEKRCDGPLLGSHHGRETFVGGLVALP
jgi:hypothetical protein